MSRRFLVPLALLFACGCEPKKPLPDPASPPKPRVEGSAIRTAVPP